MIKRKLNFSKLGILSHIWNIAYMEVYMELNFWAKIAYSLVLFLAVHFRKFLKNKKMQT